MFSERSMVSSGRFGSISKSENPQAVPLAQPPPGSTVFRSVELCELRRLSESVRSEGFYFFLGFLAGFRLITSFSVAEVLPSRSDVKAGLAGVRVEYVRQLTRRPDSRVEALSAHQLPGAEPGIRSRFEGRCRRVERE